MSEVFDRPATRPAARPAYVQKTARNAREAVHIGLVQGAASATQAAAIDDAEQLLLRGMPTSDVARLQNLTKNVTEKLGQGLGRPPSTRCGRPPKSLGWFVANAYQHMWGSVFINHAMRLREAEKTDYISGSAFLRAIQLTELVGGPMPGALQKIRVLEVGLQAAIRNDVKLRECPTHKVPYLVLHEAEKVEGVRTRGECPLCVLQRDRRTMQRTPPKAPRDFNQANLESSSPVPQRVELTSLA
jgi:hypothetical protein